MIGRALGVSFVVIVLLLVAFGTGQLALASHVPDDIRTWIGVAFAAIVVAVGAARWSNR